MNRNVTCRNAVAAQGVPPLFFSSLPFVPISCLTLPKTPHFAPQTLLSLSISLLCLAFDHFSLHASSRVFATFSYNSVGDFCDIVLELQYTIILIIIDRLMVFAFTCLVYKMYSAQSDDVFCCFVWPAVLNLKIFSSLS